MKLGISALIVTLLGISTAAVAQQPPAGGAGGPPTGSTQDYIKSLDKDGDGKLSKDEVAGTPMAADFDEIDTNKDGKLVAKEMEDFLPKVKARAAAGGGQPPAGAQPPAQK
jgi:hypothetical protein